ncbi:TetR/AcrR family transcriptional regulator [Psychromonas aquimarina]|uniref:TetR/AcrR family transcriptional regulator n=1 Tax=Psychromonas aquimarina TaxID=444919 RepID=UPI00040FE0A5|nr:TetR/AcrR family transcriptional regulator [Psychromonas aquimarina]
MPSETFERLNQQKKNRILSAAQKEFSKSVYEKAKVVNICKEAGIPRVTFYSYFSSLDDIYRYLYTTLSHFYIEGSAADCRAGEYDLVWEEYYMKLIESDKGQRILYSSMQSAALEERMLHNISMSLAHQVKLKLLSRSDFIAELSRMRTKLFE